MAQNEWFTPRRLAIVVASMGGVALASCSSTPGGIVVEHDGSGGAKDSASDTRESGGSPTGGSGGAAGTAGAAGAIPDSAADIVSDASDDRSGDSGPPPMCVFHTPPPPAILSSFDESSADGSIDDASDATEAGSADTGIDTGSADVAVIDAGSQDGAVVDAPPTTDGSATDTVADATGDASGDRSGGRDGAGDAGPAPSITVLNSAFLGPYLADSAGRTLYTFGNDKPGDCMYPPIPDCENDCAIAWPPFDAGKRTLAMGLDAEVFGSTARGDGGDSQITTYYGWPLYYYRPDTASGAITGHGKSKTWHVATVTPFNMMIMRDKTNPRYVADGNGHTLYVFDRDTAGTDNSDPVSACVGACLTQYPPFQRNRINAVSTLDTNDLTLFVRPDTGRQQVAYKGAPLYLSAADMRSGDQIGLTMGWTAAAAP